MHQLKPSGTIELSQLADTLAALIEARPDLHEGLALVGRAYGLGEWLPKPRVELLDLLECYRLEAGIEEQ